MRPLGRAAVLDGVEGALEVVEAPADARALEALAGARRELEPASRAPGAPWPRCRACGAADAVLEGERERAARDELEEDVRGSQEAAIRPAVDRLARWRA